MGTFTSPITLFSASGGKSEVVDAVVDTGSTFTTVPQSILERLGIDSHRTVRLRLADGQTAERRLGRVMVELAGIHEEILCVFGENGDLPLIGAHALEALLLAVDPVEQRLVAAEGYWV